VIEFTLTRTSTASIETVFDAMTDHRAIAENVSMFRRSTLDREGTPTPNGRGAVRRLIAIGPPFVEEIIEYQRPTRYAYKMLSGAPIRDHIGTIELREAGTGTEVSWHLRSTLKISGVDRADAAGVQEGHWRPPQGRHHRRRTPRLSIRWADRSGLRASVRRLGA
jgi:uncharacterized protein YndB with AHSA1/START domain